MKKLTLLIIVLLVLLSGCGSKSNETEKESDKKETVEVDEKLFDVTITLPNSFFEMLGTTAEEYVKGDENNKDKYKNVEINDDGSVKITMSKSDYGKLMEGLKVGVDQSLEDIINSGDYNIEDIEHDSKFEKFKVKLSTNELGLMDGMSVLAFSTFGGIYQLFDGNENPHIEVVFTNPAGEEIKTWDSDSLKETNASPTTIK